MINKYLQAEKDDFNYVKYNLYETEITPIIEEALTMPFFQIKSNFSSECICLYG